MAARILVVEDETALSQALCYNLEREGYEARPARDGETGLELARSWRPDLILLDLMLPRLSGLDLCRILRRESRVPIITLTARGDELDKIAGLDAGADDYVTKPFAMGELLARVRAVLRRTPGAAEREAEALSLGDIVVDPERRRAEAGARPLALAPKEFDLLRTLVEAGGRVVTREALIGSVWGADYAGQEHTLDVHVSWLRRKLGEAGSDGRIEAVRGLGYRLVAPS